MSIRVTALCILVAALSVYAWKDWFKSLCGLIVLMAVIEHPDMPKSMMGIQGLNPWNALLASVFLAWLASRRREGLKWDMPRHMNVLLLIFLAVILTGFARAVLDMGSLSDHYGYTQTDLISEQLINTVKWLLPGFLLFDGCRDKRRLRLAVTCIMGLFVFLTVQVIRYAPPSAAFDFGALVTSRRVLHKNMGYHSVDLSVILAGAAWAFLSILPLARRTWHRASLILAFLGTTYAQAVTGGRAGYIAWGVTGLAVCALRAPKYLLLAPVVVVLLYVSFPGAAARALYGTGEIDVSGEVYADFEDKMTAGRPAVWGYVIDKISESPILGYGRLAMQRTGTHRRIIADLGESGFAHPHNAYLQWLLDNGLLGAVPLVALFGYLLSDCVMAFRSRSGSWPVVIGGIGFALLFSHLVAAIGSQSFYPREGSFAMWTSLFLVQRVRVDQARLRARLDAFLPSGGAHPVKISVVDARRYDMLWRSSR